MQIQPKCSNPCPNGRCHLSKCPCENPLYSILQDSEEAWRQLLAVVTLVARHDPRPLVGDSAATGLMKIIHSHGQAWNAAIWKCVLKKGIAYLFDLPPPHAKADTPVVSLLMAVLTLKSIIHDQEYLYRPACLSHDLLVSFELLPNTSKPL